MKTKRIAIIGLPGSGKSTFAVRLGKALSLPVYHLDTHMFDEAGSKRGHEHMRDIQRGIVSNDCWVIEGCSLSTLETRYSRATDVVYLQFNRLFCLYRLLKRSLFFESSLKGTGCIRVINWPLFKYVWRFQQDKGSEIQRLKIQYPQVRFHIFHSPKQAEDFFQTITQGGPHA